MPRPKQITDEELLKIALDCFLENGPNVSVQIIADRAGISQPAIFKRFGTKEELFLQALSPPEHLPVVDWINKYPDPGPFPQQLVEMLEQVWKTLKWVFPRIQVIRDARLPNGIALSRYKVSPPVRILSAIESYMDRAKQLGHIRKNVETKFIAQWIFGVLMGRLNIREALPPREQKKDHAFIKATAELLCAGLLRTE